MVDPITYVKKKAKQGWQSFKVRVLGEVAEDIEEKRDEIKGEDKEEEEKDD